MTFADRIIHFNKHLTYTGKALPPGIRIMNPFKESEQAIEISEMFYRKYYNDNNRRFLILGINPGRFGAGLTGIPFTDPKHLIAACGIPFKGKLTHEPSSVFIYRMIATYGGVNVFYHRFHFNSLCPLGFTLKDDKGREKNYNYYDSMALAEAVHGFVIENIRKQIDLGIDTRVCFCLGTGKNQQYLARLNDEHHFFGKIISLEHPRFITQYKARNSEFYIHKYVNAFRLQGM